MFETVLEFAKKTAKEVGEYIEKKKEEFEITERKDARDICTSLDLEAEKMIIEEIKETFPDHKILSEERGEVLGEDEYLWVIDPIDGTKFFIYGVPFYTVSLGLIYNQEVILGVVYHPPTNSLYYGLKGKGAFLNDKKIEVSKRENLKEAMVAVDYSKTEKLSKEEFPSLIKKLHSLLRNVYRIRNLGCGSLSLCYLAQGFFDCYVDLTGYTKPVDIAAGIAIVKSAGGKVTDLQGSPFRINSKFCVASNRILHNDLLKILNNK